MNQGLARTTILGYIRERSKVSSQHKLPTFSELENSISIALALGLEGRDRSALAAILEKMGEDGLLIKYGPYYSTEQISTL